MRSAQEFIHWLEMGRGARALRVAAVVAVTVAVSLLISWKQFHGPQTEATLEEADVGHQLAEGRGFSTQVNYPQTAAVLARRGEGFDATRLYPELHHPPLYSALIAGGLRLFPAGRRHALFVVPADVSEGYGADYFLLGLNLVLLWCAAWLTYCLGRRLFEPRVGWVAALALLVSLPFWHETLALNGTPLLMVLGLATFLVWTRVEVCAAATESETATAPAWVWLLVLGVLCGLVFLTEYTGGVLLGVAVVYAGLRFGRRRGVAIATVLVGFTVIAGPWCGRNFHLAGNPVALATQEVALKAGDPTAEPVAAHAAFSAELPAINLRKLGNKTLSVLQDALQTKLWSGGAMWLTAFFVAGWLYAFRSPVTNRLRWVFTASIAVLLVAQAALNSGDADRAVVVWMAPVMIVFGAGFFFVLLGSNAVLGAWPRLAAAVLLLVQALPLVHDALAPAPAIRFQYPPYFPVLLRGLRTELAQRGALERFGIMADVPAGVAWYGNTRAWARPAQLRDFYQVTLEQPIGELLLTPRTLDRPFFTELNAHGVAPGALSAVPNRFGEWGEIYGGLVTGNLPREFPLTVPHKVAENLFVLLNPALPPVREK